MELAEIQRRLAERFGPAISPVMPGRVESWIEVDADRIDEVARFLAEDPELAFDCLANLSGVDYPAKGAIEVVYRLFSYRHRHEITVKVDADRDRPRVATV
ncbi:MAG: NADH-quinone oxidoreductase subunit C, partial [Deltaproteobacteria bacterium]